MGRRFRLHPGLPDGAAARLRRGFKTAGWEAADGPSWDLLWDAGPPPTEAFGSLEPGQQINHFPGFSAFGHKGDLHKNLTAACRRTANPDFYQFHPRTFSIPEQYERWRALAVEEPDRLWIVKPPRGGQGQDISVVHDVDRVPRTGEWIVQEYLDRPHLIGGRKYVLRFWLLVASLDPLVCYLHDNGVFKQASKPFTTDVASTTDLRVHLTNPTVHRDNTEVAWGSLNSDLSGYRAHLRGMSIDDRPIMDEVRDALIQSVIACRDQALLRSRSATSHLSGCFELLGPDILVDEDLKPWVLELNVFPSLDISPEGDPTAAGIVMAAKEKMVADLARLLSVEEGEFPERIGGFRRVWPDEDADRFAGCHPLMRPADRALASEVCPSIAQVHPPIRSSTQVKALPLGKGLALQVSDDDGVRLVALDPIGAAAWLCLADSLQPDQIVDELGAVFPSESRDRIEADVWDLLAIWAQMGLLTDSSQALGPSAKPLPEARA